MKKATTKAMKCEMAVKLGLERERERETEKNKLWALDEKVTQKACRREQTCKVAKLTHSTCTLHIVPNSAKVAMPEIFKSFSQGLTTKQRKIQGKVVFIIK